LVWNTSLWVYEIATFMGSYTPFSFICHPSPITHGSPLLPLILPFLFSSPLNSLQVFTQPIQVPMPWWTQNTYYHLLFHNIPHYLAREELHQVHIFHEIASFTTKNASIRHVATVTDVSTVAVTVATRQIGHVSWWQRGRLYMENKWPRVINPRGCPDTCKKYMCPTGHVY